MFGNKGKLSREEDAAIRERVRIEMDERRKRGFGARLQREYIFVMIGLVALVAYAKLTGHIPAGGP